MNQLTPEQLDMIKRLQPLFREKMGAWKEDDYGKYGDCDPEVMVMYIADMNSPDTPQSWKDIWLRIPKPIDWQNPERGLWGMINWKRFDIKRVSESGGVFLTDRDSGDGFADPSTALLMALCSQEGV